MHVLSNADDLALRLFELGSVSFPEQNALPDRIAFRPKLPGQSLINDCDAGSRGVVPMAEDAAADNRNFENVELVWRHSDPAAPVVAAAGWCPANNVEWHAESTFQRQSVTGARAQHGRQSLDPLNGILDEPVHTRRLLEARFGQLHSHGEDVMRIEAGIYRAQGHKAADQQCRADQQHQRERHLADH